MSAYTRRLERERSRVRTRSRVFTDSADSHADFLVDGGEAPTASHAQAAWPPVLPLSGYAEDLIDLPPLNLTLGDLSPVLDSVVVPRRPGRAGVQRSRVRRSEGFRRDWLEFQKLRLDPRVRTCVRRKQRRSVMFALRVAGRRRSAPGRVGGYRRNVHSQWSC